MKNNSMIRTKLFKFITLLFALSALTVSVLQSQGNKKNKDKEIIFDSSKSGLPKKSKESKKEKPVQEEKQKDPSPEKNTEQNESRQQEQKKFEPMPSSKAPIIPGTIKTKNEK